MAQFELYYGAEILPTSTMTAGQRLTLDGLLQAMGQANSDPNPRRRLHRRLRLDSLAAIYQGLLDEATELSVAAFKAKLASVFGVNVSLITSSSTTTTFATLQSTVVTFTYNSAAQFRVVVFGYTGSYSPTLTESAIEARAYLAANAAAWGEVLA